MCRRSRTLTTTRDEGCWLVDASGRRVRVGPAGLLIGREPTCDLVLHDRRVSRVHAMVRWAATTADVIPLGRRPTHVNGEVVTRRTRLRDEDRIGVPGASFLVRVRRVPGREITWAVRVDERVLFGLSRGPLSVGGALADGLQLPGLPPGAVRFERTDVGVAVDAGRAGVRVDGRQLGPGEVEIVGECEVIVGDHTLRVVSDGPAAGSSTEGTDEAGGALAVSLTFEPVGAHVAFVTPALRAELTLSELKSRLVAALIQPPGGYEAGDFVPDEVLIPAVWPGQADRDRIHVNMLVHRVRKSLAQGGLDPATLIERAAAGGATRLRLAAGAKITVD